MAKLTATGIAKMKAGNERREIRDPSGLILIIQPSGQKSWAMRFRRPDGRTAKLTLGSVDLDAPELEEAPQIGMPLSLASARLLAADINRRRAKGEDVIDKLQRQKDQRRKAEEDEAYTFPAAVRQFIKEHAQKNKNRGWRAVAKVLGLSYVNDKAEPEVIRASLADRWRDRSVRDIDGRDIFSVVDESIRRGIPGLGRRNDELSDPRGRSVGRALSKLFAWLLQQRKIDGNPCIGMYVPPPPKSRERTLSGEEIRLIWKHSAGYPFGPLVRLLLLTGCRRDEVGELRLDELSEDRSTWTIPSGRTKNKKSHVVPLSPEAEKVIAEAITFPGNSPYLFTTTGISPFSGYSKCKARLDKKMREELGDAFLTWQLHDIRRTVVTEMNETIGIPPHIVEAVVNHVSGAKAGVAGVYNRATYPAQKKQALEAWARHLDQIISGTTASVVPIMRAGGDRADAGNANN
jgi:integrase